MSPIGEANGCSTSRNANFLPRQRAGHLPISDDVYRLGDSLEALRDLAERGESGTTTENGTYHA